MRKTFTSLAMASAMLAGAFMAPTLVHAQAAGTVLTVTLEGPGGHSNGNYSRTSAVHAAARAITNLAQQTAVPAKDFSVYDFGGGNSVNSIASDGTFKVAILATDATAKAAVEAAVKTAVETGVKAENDFRGVKEGDLTSGVPANIRYTIK